MADTEKKSTMKGFATNDQADYYSGIRSIRVNGNNYYELNGKFLDDLHINAFSGTNEKDAKLGSNEIEPTNEEPSDLEETDHDDEQEIGEIFRIETNLFDYETPIWRNDGYCNRGNLPGAYIIENSLQYQDYEWYEALEDEELKEECWELYIHDLVPLEDHLLNFYKYNLDAKEMLGCHQNLDLVGNGESKKFQSLLTSFEILGCGVSIEGWQIRNALDLYILPGVFEISMLKASNASSSRKQICHQLDHEDLERLDEFLIRKKWTCNGRLAFGLNQSRVILIVTRQGILYDECSLEPMENQDSKRRDAWIPGNKDGRRSGKQDDSKALVTIDGEGVDWTSHSKEEEDFALMACNSSGSDTEVNTAEVNAVSAVGGRRETAVKPSAGCNWRPKRHYWHKISKYNGGSRPRDCATFKDPLGRLKPKQAWAHDWKQGLPCWKSQDFNVVMLLLVEVLKGLRSMVKMCDKKNKVLFTDTECLVLSPEFKLPNENQLKLSGRSLPKKLRICFYKQELLKLAVLTQYSEIPALKEIYANPTDSIFTNSTYDDEGVVADFTNLEPIMNASPIPSSRIKYSHLHLYSWSLLNPVAQSRSKVTKSSEPMLLIEAIRIFLAFASYMRFIVYQMDVKSAFLYGKIDEEVYVSQPPGFIDPKFPKKDKYVAEILKKFDFVSEFRLLSTPFETGALVKVTPKTSHLSAVKRIFRYLKGKPKLGLWYPRVSSFDLEAYSDSDYAGANLDRKSTTGGCQFLGRRLISWQCKKQTIVATSTTEAEYVAAANCCGQVLWIQNQMLDYGFNFMNTKIYIDNESTICIVKNPVYHSKTKHIAIRHHFIRDAYEKKLIQVLKIHTDDNVADLLTKAFDVSRDTDGIEALLLPNLFILALTVVSTDSAKLIPLGKDSTAIETLKKIPPRV
ncbi:putative ribonuclease H-like domain-containing protein [Tanacetum coccineum]